MRERIKNELELLRNYYPEIEYRSKGNWFYLSSYSLPEGWNREETEIAFQINNGYPGSPPYGFYVPTGIKFHDKSPKKYKKSPKNSPPFDGEWGLFSWSHNNEWNPTADLKTGSNLLNWVNSFKDRFKGGA